jgi:hypothetical protein
MTGFIAGCVAVIALAGVTVFGGGLVVGDEAVDEETGAEAV